jgi:hypothetical protein
MLRKAIFFFLAGLCIFGKSDAQTIIPCGSDEALSAAKNGNPDIAKYETDLENQIQHILKSSNISKFLRTTSNSDTVWFDIPIVFHVIHDYGQENIPDNKIYGLVQNMNNVYALRNDVSSIISPFVPYIGKAYIRFHLASKDPYGMPTNGVTRRFSYETYGGCGANSLYRQSDEFAKFDQWNPSSYVNIWVENFIGEKVSNGIILAYATPPASGAANPYGDGIITCYNGSDGEPNTIPHEMGHIFNLMHPWGGTNNPEVACGDDDVDDTPPTKGQFSCGPSRLYDTACANGYFKIYPSSVSGVDSLVDYPDTANTQNIMDYSSCEIMFTKLQVARMRAALRSTTANRDSLWTPYNLAITGALTPKKDLPPVADFSVQNGLSYSITRSTRFFQCTGNTFYFKNQSWNDTLSNLQWTFSNGATTPTQTVSSGFTTAMPNSFSNPGWVTVTLVAKSNAGSDTIVKTPIYVADHTGIKPKGYVQEFNSSAGNDLDKWPMFNYYNNEFKWQLVSNNGYDDNYCIMYTGYDSRIIPAIYVGSPKGDFDDFFTPAFDLTQFATGECNLNFMYAGATKSGVSLDMNDTLDISYSTDCGTTWTLLNNHHYTKGELSTYGALGIPYAPLGSQDWQLRSINIPNSARTNSTFFRFRYLPGVFAQGNTYGYGGFSSGNNFYIDRINVNNEPLGVNTILPKGGVAVLPNPTTSSAFVIIKQNGNSTAKIIVSDITGKQVYSTEKQMTGDETRIEIPEQYISTRGMYMVQVISGNSSTTEKLVVY